MFQGNCLPILIGSLPQDNHEAAMQLILKHCPEIPLWPQLPARKKEGMIRQFMTGFPGLRDTESRSYIDTSAPEFELEIARFYEDFFMVKSEPSTLLKSRFGLEIDSAPGFSTLVATLEETQREFVTLKGQITGPITTGIGLKDENNIPILYNHNLRDVLIKHLGLKGLWQGIELQKFTGKAQPIVFIDEPGIVSFGSTGFPGVTREMVSESVAEVIDTLHSNDILVGIHVCANGDWGPPLTSNTDIISFDSYFYFDNFILYREELIAFLKRGGILAWGIIPTGDPAILEKEDTISLFQKWRKQLATLCELGFSERQVMQQTLIAPSCGTGSMVMRLAEKVLMLTAEVSKMARAYLAETG